MMNEAGPMSEVTETKLPATKVVVVDEARGSGDYDHGLEVGNVIRTVTEKGGRPFTPTRGGGFRFPSILRPNRYGGR